MCSFEPCSLSPTAVRITEHMATDVMTGGRPQPPAAYRWTVLVFVSIAMFGNYYPYDAVAPVADILS